MRIFDDFRRRLLKNYNKDPWYFRLKRQIKNNKKLDKNAVILSFIRELEYYRDLESSFDLSLESSNSLFDSLLKSSNSLLLLESSNSLSLLESSNSLIESKDNLIYYINRVIEYQRLCILSTLIKEILHLVYENDHLEF